MDVTGKATGKRILDENGNWRTVASLPREIQDEILKQNKIQAGKRRDKALANNKEFASLEADKKNEILKEENKDLRSMVKEQGEMLAKINAKMELGASVKMDTPSPKKEETVSVKPKKMTPKQKLQAQCELDGVDYELDDTIAELKEKMSVAATDSF